MTLDDLFAKMPTAFNPSAASGVNATVQFNCSKPRNVVIKDGAVTINQGTAADPTVAITMQDQDLLDMLTGKLDGMSAFMTGKLQLDGDMMFAQRMGSLFDYSKVG